ncbi:MAG TPA: dephospho-CoA kinase [Clostridia bacterium]|nr:dephospho-CoA kinase [Clostridia bacterium]
MVIGLTGNIASGKSTVAQYLRDKGFQVLDMDNETHIIYQRGNCGYNAIKEEFGDRFVDPDGTLNRAKLGKYVFADRARLKRLNEIIHPLLVKRAGEFIRTHKDERAVFIEAYGIIEAGMLDMLDRLWLVAADEKLRLARLMERGLDEHQAKLRIDAQMSEDKKKKYASCIIDTGGSFEDTFAQVDACLKKEGLLRDETEA